MKSLLTGVILIFSTSIYASPRSEFIESTKSILSSTSMRIESKIIGAYKKIDMGGGIDDFKYGYACTDLGEAQFAIDLALHNQMEVTVVKTIYKRADGTTNVITEVIDLDKLYGDIDKVVKEFCLLKIN